MDINQKTHILSILAPRVSAQEWHEVDAALTAAVQNGSLDSLPTSAFADKALETADLINRLLAIAGARQEQTPRTFNGMVTQALDVLEARLAAPEAGEVENTLYEPTSHPLLETEHLKRHAIKDALVDLIENQEPITRRNAQRALGWKLEKLLGARGYAIVPAALTTPPAAAEAGVLHIAQPSNGPATCSPLSCDGCPQCRPVQAQGLPVDENVPLRTRFTTCPDCGGTGESNHNMIGDHDSADCGTCDGSGVIDQIEQKGGQADA